MATKTTTTVICDRCKKSMDYSPWEKKTFKIERKFRKITKAVLQAPSTETWRNYKSAELCRDCAKALDKWLNTPPMEDNA